ncbi:MAG: tRNA cyclic N6-threonylcarbamoyladenosine(37) synthase TcdA [Arenicella sp.]|jgi:tRNA A37 threonylcarbamoyladenosine dehydratase|nr:tRNA cyclic N6-threonylcarbamoyladenosine(37) synthase TcdA [Arenicella sp.]HAU67683.1 tRNA cyclic N6-threonylcarbamoyladenosine(37) synthase TcdA [Gammaproteobacteria bacterium]
MSENHTMNYAKRFGGIARVYGDAGLAKLQAAHVCVIGLGGVGSWVAESLARSGVGAITLIDLDVVAESNINRQLVATDDQIGRGKIAVMEQRIQHINPSCKVTCVDDFVSRDNLDELIQHTFDYVIDCIDDFRTKAALIAYCRTNKIKILTTGGAGGQIDPSKILLADLSNTEHDVLLAKTRKLLRQDYGFSKNLKRSFGVKTVYSKEQLNYPDGEGGLSPQRPKSGDSEETLNGLNCAGGLGSITHVTASFAMFAAAHVLNSIAASTKP